MKNIINTLESLTFFQGVSYQQLTRFSSYCSMLEYEKGEVIYSAKSDFPYIGIIIDGQVTYYLNGINGKKKVKISSFKKYPVGMFKLMELKDYSITIEAKKHTKLIAIKYKKLQQLEEDLPLLTSRLYRSLLKLNMQVMMRLGTTLAVLANKK